MKMKKRIALLLCMVLLLPLFGCDASESSGGVDIGIVLPTKDEPRWLQDEARFKEILGDTDYSVEILFSQGNTATEKTNVETLVNKGIDVLVICAQDGAAAAAAVEYAKAEGVKVISYDRLITDTDAVDYYVTFDSFTVGAEWGKYLVSKAEGTGNNLYLYAGGAGDNNSFIFFQGAWSVLQPKIADGTFVIRNSSEAVALQDKADLTRDELSKIIFQVTTDWDFNSAKGKAEAHLNSVGAAEKGVCYVCAPNDGTARAIADVFAADGDVSEFYITGQDAELASVKYILDGKQSMTVFKDTRTLASDAIQMATDILEKKTPATTSTYNNNVIDVPAKQTQVLVVEKDTVQSILIDSGYYTQADIDSAK